MAANGSGPVTAEADDDAHRVEKLPGSDTIAVPDHGSRLHRTDTLIGVTSSARAVEAIDALADRAARVGQTLEERRAAQIDLCRMAGRQGGEIAWTAIAADPQLAGLPRDDQRVMDRLDHVLAACQQEILAYNEASGTASPKHDARTTQAFSRVFVGRVRHLSTPTVGGRA